MASKRPSYVSVRARQRNLIEGIREGSFTEKQAAARLGVTRPQLHTMITSDPKKLRKSYNRSPMLAKLYREGERKETRKALGLKRIHKVEFRENVLRRTEVKTPEDASYQQAGRMIQKLYTGPGEIGLPAHYRESQDWAAASYAFNLPTSIESIVFLNKNGKVKNYHQVIASWAEIYGITSQHQISSKNAESLWAEVISEI